LTFWNSTYILDSVLESYVQSLVTLVGS